MTSDSEHSSVAARRVAFWIRHPALASLLLGLVLVLGVLIWPMLVRSPAVDQAELASGLPWSIERLPHGGSRVFGLDPGVTPLQVLQDRAGDDLRIAILAGLRETGALEAAIDNYRAGFITGKLIVSVAAEPEMIKRWRMRPIKREMIDGGGGTSRETLHPDDLALALRQPITGISFIPSVQLDAAMVQQRFGAPAEQLQIGQQQHWLYPDQGLAVTIDPKGRELLQYVAPREFDLRLRRPLVAAHDKAGAASAS